jgi:hypothetical protein
VSPVFGFDDGQHRGRVHQLAWRGLAFQLAAFLAVLVVGRLLVGDDSSIWLRLSVVALAVAATLAVHRRGHR